MSPLKSHKGSTTFGTVNTPSNARNITPKEWAALLLVAGFPPTPKVIAEGLGILNAESSLGTNMATSGAHIGPWAESSAFGSAASRLDPLKSTEAALKQWEADGKSFYPAWGRWEKEQSGRDGATDWPKYKQIAEEAVSSGVGNFPRGGGFNPLDPIETAVEGVESAEQFLQTVAETLLDFRALGNLAAKAMAWFIRLIARAIWDYVIAPLVHWSERAVSFYWINFFGSGTEQGSGFGYQLRNNAGAITILFWSMGYSILWSDGTSLSPVTAHESLLGQSVKGIEGAIARRNLIKPGKVKEKTPAKPTPKESKVKIERKQTFSVARKRPVSVHSEGRHRVSSQGFKPRPVPRPTKQKPEQKIILPPGTKTQKRPPEKNTRPAKQSGPRVGT